MNYNIKSSSTILKKNTEEHPFHLVNSSIWPMTLALSLYNLFIILIAYFNYFTVASITYDLGIWKCTLYSPFFYFIILLFFLTRWLLDIVREATFEGYHTTTVQTGIYIGMILFGWEAIEPNCNKPLKPVKFVVTTNNWLRLHDLDISMVQAVLVSTPIRHVFTSWVKLHELQKEIHTILTLSIGRMLKAVWSTIQQHVSSILLIATRIGGEVCNKQYYLNSEVRGTQFILWEKNWECNVYLRKNEN
jgi:hypothetical protein